MPNRLANETSLYLLQHKDNPVDWRPWGREAFDEARRRDVPVFLSVGYSSCYWCHVMEREVFENEDLARQMNEQFVCIKVDREQRPDVDEHYMMATQVLSGQGGWPMSVFLTPAGEPFFAGTYFPPTDYPNRPSFGRVMTALTEAWQQRRSDLMETASEVRRVLQELAQPRRPQEDVTFDRDSMKRLTEDLVRDFDPTHGGFGRAPKFPRQTLLEALLVHRSAINADEWDRPLRRTLDAMADGGIRDHLGGGFHRYSTDARWLVPHFEIMLYDQAMLAWCYVEAYRQFQEPRYAFVARRCLNFVLSDMCDLTTGTFYSALDAEAEAKEGGPYLWTPDEVREVLGDEDAATFNRVYGLDRGFNFADPHGPAPHSPDRNVLFLAEPERETEPELNEMREKLLAARKQRPQPLLDTKVITSWNGLMIRALAHAAEVLDEPAYHDAGQRAAAWLLEHHRLDNDMLARSSREEQLDSATATLEDYAHLAHGCVALGGDWPARAEQLLVEAERLIKDDADGAFFNRAAGLADEDLLSQIRRKEGSDNPLPSGNGTAANVLLALGRPDDCRRLLTAFAGTLWDHPGSACTLLSAGIRYSVEHAPFTVEAGATAETAPPSVADEAGAIVSLDAEWVSGRQLDVKLTVADGFHLYAPNHDGPERSVELSVNKGPALEEVVYPTPADGKVRGTGVFHVVFAEPADPTVVEAGVELMLAYQACDDTRCLPPVRKSFLVRPAS